MFINSREFHQKSKHFSPVLSEPLPLLFTTRDSKLDPSPHLASTGDAKFSCSSTGAEPNCCDILNLSYVQAKGSCRRDRAYSTQVTPRSCHEDILYRMFNQDKRFCNDGGKILPKEESDGSSFPPTDFGVSPTVREIKENVTSQLKLLNDVAPLDGLNKDAVESSHDPLKIVTPHAVPCSILPTMVSPGSSQGLFSETPSSEKTDLSLGRMSRKRQSKQQKSSGYTASTLDSDCPMKIRGKFHGKRGGRQARSSRQPDSQHVNPSMRQCVSEKSYCSNVSRFELIPLPNVVKSLSTHPDYSLLSNQLEHPFPEQDVSCCLAPEKASYSKCSLTSPSCSSSETMSMSRSLFVEGLKLIAETLDISLQEVHRLISCKGSHFPGSSCVVSSSVLSKAPSDPLERTEMGGDTSQTQALHSNPLYPKPTAAPLHMFPHRINSKSVFSTKPCEKISLLGDELVHGGNPLDALLCEHSTSPYMFEQLNCPPVGYGTPEAELQVSCMSHKTSSLSTQSRSMKGVSFDRSKRNWEASWLDAQTGKRVKKCFSEGRWGSSARDMAILARRKAEVSGIISTRQQMHTTPFLVLSEAPDIKMASSCIALGKPAESLPSTAQGVGSEDSKKHSENPSCKQDDQNDVLLQRIAQHVKSLLPQNALSKVNLNDSAKHPLTTPIAHKRLLKPFPTSYDITTTRSKC